MLKASDRFAADGVCSTAVKGAFGDIGDLADGCCCCDDLESRAGRIRRRERTVQISAVIFIVCFDIVGYILRIIGGCADHADDLTCFVIIDKYSALVAAQRFESGFLDAAVNGERYIVADDVDLVFVVHHGRQTKPEKKITVKFKARERGTVDRLYGGSDIDRVVTDNVQTRHACFFVFVIISLFVDALR